MGRAFCSREPEQRTGPTREQDVHATPVVRHGRVKRRVRRCAAGVARPGRFAIAGPGRLAMNTRVFPRRSSAAAAWLATATTVCGAAFDPEAGLPVIRNFPPESYRGHNQVFASVQAPDGVMNFGTYGAVVSFDGERWRQHSVPGTWIRALAAGADGLIYVGGGGLLGRFEPAADGAGPRFVSLADRLPEAQRDFATTWSAAAAGDAVLFSIDGAALAWRGGAFRVWPFPGLRPAIRAAGPAVFCHAGDQLLRWDGADWRPFARDSRLAAARRVTLLPTDTTAILVALDSGTMLQADANVHRRRLSQHRHAGRSRRRIVHCCRCIAPNCQSGITTGALIRWAAGDKVQIVAIDIHRYGVGEAAAAGSAFQIGNADDLATVVVQHHDGPQVTCNRVDAGIDRVARFQRLQVDEG